MKIKCLVVDDEPLAAELVATHVVKMPELELVGTCCNAFEASAVLQREQIDLLFLDIHMPRMTGWELLKNLPVRPLVVITTAYRDYAFDLGFAELPSSAQERCSGEGREPRRGVCCGG